nr:hypothetical protein [Tanacetum cinerariifolium]
MTSVQISSDPAPECQTMALEHDNLSPRRSAVSAADAPIQRQQPTTPLNNHTTPAPTCQNPSIEPTVISSENINQAESHAENDQDHPLEQVIGNPLQSVRTRRQLELDAEMC